jgi:hypothetical protein
MPQPCLAGWGVECDVPFLKKNRIFILETRNHRHFLNHKTGFYWFTIEKVINNVFL